eukprot:scaffold34827_cov172-Skeletonema_dohrnii-CCMP3373.AAC.1
MHTFRRRRHCMNGDAASEKQELKVEGRVHAQEQECAALDPCAAQIRYVSSLHSVDSSNLLST